MKREDCEGCATLANGACPYFDENLVCPCSICLIKVMCDHMCSSFKIYRSNTLVKNTRCLVKN